VTDVVAALEELPLSASGDGEQTSTIGVRLTCESDRVLANYSSCPCAKCQFARFAIERRERRWVTNAARNKYNRAGRCRCFDLMAGIYS